METPNKTRVYLEFGICFDKNFIGRIFIQEVTVMIHKNTDGQGQMAEKKNTATSETHLRDKNGSKKA